MGTYLAPQTTFPTSCSLRLTTHIPCVVGAVGTHVALPVQGKVPGPRPGFAPTTHLQPQGMVQGTPTAGDPNPRGPQPWLAVSPGSAAQPASPEPEGKPAPSMLCCLRQTAAICSEW